MSNIQDLLAPNALEANAVGDGARQPWEPPLLVIGDLDATRSGGGHHGDYATNSSSTGSGTAPDVFAPS